MDHALITRADRLLRERYVPGRHVVAAALRAEDGSVFTGLHIAATVARISLCAEAVALAHAIMAGYTRLDTIVALHHVPTSGSDVTSALVSPCGMCRELLGDYAPDLRVILPGQRGEPVITTMLDLLPRKFIRPHPEKA